MLIVVQLVVFVYQNSVSTKYVSISWAVAKQLFSTSGPGDNRIEIRAPPNGEQLEVSSLYSK